jgi:Fic family protein
MYLTPEQLNQVEEMAYRCFAPFLIAINLELDEIEFIGQIFIEGTNIRKAYFKGLIRQQMELREALIKAAHNGSNPAQEQLMKIMEQLKGFI